MQRKSEVRLLLNHTGHQVRGTGRVLGAERLAIEKVDRVDGECDVAAAHIVFEHGAVSLLKVATGRAHVVNEDCDVDWAFGPVGVACLTLFTALQGRCRHHLQVFGKGDPARDHVERARACRLHGLRDHERDNGRNGQHADHDAALQHKPVALFALLLGLLGKTRLLASKLAALVLGKFLVHYVSIRARAGAPEFMA